ncbi:MAG: hypothetical protein COA77_07330 [Thaumarchaeota archaeon]|nr:MAG: hypothetical protein COA77_07330 [Nitrososphaerota archaeon]
MVQMCNGLCERLKVTSTRNGLRYKLGQKRCSLCAQFFSTTEISCPCCKTRLRSKPKNRNRVRT